MHLIVKMYNLCIASKIKDTLYEPLWFKQISIFYLEVFFNQKGSSAFFSIYGEIGMTLELHEW